MPPPSQPRTRWGTPPLSGTGLDGVPPPPLWRTGYAWTGYGAGGTPLAVSRRMTFLFKRALEEMFRSYPDKRHNAVQCLCVSQVHLD